MPQPLSTITRPDLGEVMREYALDQTRNRFIGLKLMPLYQTMLKTAHFKKLTANQMFRKVDTKRTPRGAYNRMDWRFAEDFYDNKEHGVELILDDAEAEEFKSYFDAEAINLEIGVDVLLRDQEDRIQKAIQAGCKTDIAVGTAWSDAAADPYADILPGVKKIRDDTGLRPDTLVISWQTFLNVMQSDAIKENIKYTQAFELLSYDQQVSLLANYLKIPRILIGDAQFNTSNENANDISLTEIWPDDEAYLVVTNDAPSLKVPCIGKTTLWTADSPDNTNVDTYREEQTRGEVIRVRHHTGEKILLPECGYKLTGLA